MKLEIYSENSHILLFTLFSSSKEKKTDSFRVHNHAELELGFITDGNGDYFIEDEKFKARDGDLFLVRPNEQHCIPTIYSERLDSFNIHVSSYFLWQIGSEFIDGRVLRKLVGSTPITHRFENMGEMMIKIRTLCESDDRFAIRTELILLLRKLCESIDPDGEISDDERLALRHLPEIQKAIAFMSEHLAEPLSLEDIARSAGLSRSHLSRLFKHITGVTPYDFLVIRRIERAVGLLRNTQASITEVAGRCGFSSLSNFNKTFKRITGLVPGECRMMKQSRES